MSRSDFWLGHVLWIGIVLVFGVPAVLLLDHPAVVGTPVSAVLSVYSFLIAVAYFWGRVTLTIRRANDRNSSGAWIVTHALVGAAYGVAQGAGWVGDLESATGVAYQVQLAFVLLYAAVGVVLNAQLFFFPGTPGDNRYGPSPSPTIYYRAPAV